MNKRLNESALIVGAAMVGAFTSRYVDKIMNFSFPWDLITLIIMMLFLLGLAYFILGGN